MLFSDGRLRLKLFGFAENSLVCFEQKYRNLIASYCECLSEECTFPFDNYFIVISSTERKKIFSPEFLVSHENYLRL